MDNCSTRAVQNMAMQEVHIVVYQQDGLWLAQCLEFDLGAQSRGTIDDVLYELQRALVGREVSARQLGIEPFDSLPAAPQKFWDMWEKANYPLPSPDKPFRTPHPAHLPKRDVRLYA